MNITLSKGGTGEKTVKLETLQIPDLWHIAGRGFDEQDRETVIECWHMAHDLKNKALESEDQREKLQQAFTKMTAKAAALRVQRNELLTACKECLDYIQGHFGMSPEGQAQRNAAREKMRAAIARAESEAV